MVIEILDRVRGVSRVIVKENQRAIALYKGKFHGVLTPGEHVLRADRGRLEIEWHDLARPEFVSSYDKALFRDHAEVAGRYLTEIRAGADEVVVVSRDKRLHAVLKPEEREVYWTEAGPWTAERVEIAEDLAVPVALQKRLSGVARLGLVTAVDVAEGHVGLLFVDGKFVRELEAGAAMFWAVARKASVKIIDLRRQSLDVTGQEVLTRDRVTLRVNLAAEYRVVDAVKAATSVKDFADALYRALQFAFRKSLGAKSLDEILADKVTAEVEAVERVRADMAAIGLSVGDIAVKDVVLPGEMRDILNKVVAAEKEAEANVIRRREETNATRSLLNTARVMAENPVMLRLKELEALSEIAGKVERLTVHNGTAGLMNDLVKLRDQ
ncbi:MAG TPA: SPFH domain-containing protein [Devosia sp.]|jgi:regulator of protease activity HflC (stomatin/prohibitin superfamily)|uniref:slipin family protein n=1 Tax=Devosia sp. TaxID=1871048 RepID=UPI002DDCF374|nr:SPFH domain-containing protein [Devosia sp.]HEV2513905.1 SPFH domain-containing protein [Devosia sp.]